MKLNPTAASRCPPVAGTVIVRPRMCVKRSERIVPVHAAALVAASRHLLARSSRPRKRSPLFLTHAVLPPASASPAKPGTGDHPETAGKRRRPVPPPEHARPSAGVSSAQ